MNEKNIFKLLMTLSCNACIEMVKIRKGGPADLLF
jgi:hypothetical protein